MFAINHAATALVLKKRFPKVRMLWLLLSVQLVELVWAVLNLVGVERTTTEATVHSVRDIHLSYMPFSHSVATTAALCALSWLGIGVLLKRPRFGAAVAIGIASHLVLDVATHGRDIAVGPWADAVEIGSGLYPALPRVAFFVECAYGVACWAHFGGSRALLWTIVGFNVANVSLFFPELTGVEALLAGHVDGLVLLIFAQIVVTLSIVGWLSTSAGRRSSMSFSRRPTTN